MQHFSVVTFQLFEYLQIVVFPSHTLYGAINRHVLKDGSFDLGDVPMFFEMFHSGGTNATACREFILRVLIASIHDFSDYKCVIHFLFLLRS